MLSASFLDFIKEEKLFNKGEHLLLAISGGLDSVVLAHLLSQNNFQFSLAHMNFQLRDEDSEKDEEFVRELAQKLKVKIFVKRVEIDPNAGSTQLQARNLRYSWFKELMKTKSFDKLLTAHHANDLLETALLNLTRGTGIKGLRSILPIQSEIARPLLFAEKSELKNFARENEIEWREDISNDSDNYTRNKVRHHIVPQLLELNPGLLSSFQQTALRLRATDEAWSEKLKDVAEEYFTNRRDRVEIDKSLLQIPYATVYLAEVIAEYGFTLSQLRSFDFNRTGAQLFSRTYVLSIDREKIFINKLEDANLKNFFPKEIELPEGILDTPFGNIKMELVYKKDIQYGRNQDTIFVDYERLKAPVQIDLWQEGDKIQPIGMRGKKKISDILIDQKVPIADKNRVLVLKSDGKIVWVIGHKFSDLFKVREESREIMRIQFSEI